MSFRFLVFFLLLPVLIRAQADSIQYYLSQINKKNLSDSLRAYYSLMISDRYLDTDPKQSLYYGKNSIQFSFKANVKRLLCASAKKVASAWLNLGEPDSSFQYATQSLLLAKELRDTSLMYEAVCTLGNVYLEKNQLPQAKSVFDEALTLAKTGSSINGRSHIYVILGYYYYKNLEVGKGIEVLKQGELIAKNEDNTSGLMDVYSCMGHLYSFANKPDSAQYYFLTALEFFHNKNMLRKEALINQGLGTAYGRIYNQPKMEEFLEKAYAQFKSIGDNLSAVNTLVQKSLAYFTLYRLEKCSQTLNIIESESREFNLESPLVMVYFCKAAISGIVGDTVVARKYQQLGEEAGKGMNSVSFQKINTLVKALTLSSKFRAKPTDSLSKKILNILQNEIPKEIMDPALQSFSVNKKLVRENPEDFINLFQVLDSGKYPDVSKFIDSAIREPLDSNMVVITNRQLLELETRYQTNQKNDSLKIQAQELILSGQEVKNRNRILIITGAFAILLSALLFFIYNLYNRERKDKARISLLRKDLQHKVKNDLSLLIRLAEITAKKEESNISIKELESRIKSIASVHDQLYASDNPDKINFKTFAEQLSRQIQKSFGTAIHFLNNIDSEFELSTNNATSLALIINELMTNSFKYAFQHTEGNQITITLKRGKKGICFYYHDNGPGVSNEKKGFGFKLIHGLSSQLNGVQRIWNESGFNYELIIPS